MVNMTFLVAARAMAHLLLFRMEEQGNYTYQMVIQRLTTTSVATGLCAGSYAVTVTDGMSDSYSNPIS